ncbi:hypothetical protein LSTR_LSTR002307 [Laodelphax striatellus]|uniref:Protein arginine N-methyltransferase n=1 Tax=Laodelphax striatellus TaxID=195883 RepID=A0A482XFQ1_LAOST|nr:hypothetical protein LSTR_LSTR002307 [Laodelphax striatellus]
MEDDFVGDWTEINSNIEIARCSYGDMLHDTERNNLYYKALVLAIKKIHSEGKKANVLDIGTGTGLLSMMAATIGADTITACEGCVPMAACARKVIKENNLESKIKVVPKHSTDLKVGPEGDMPQRANILVTEVFDSDFIGDGAISTFKHAHKELLEKDCIVIPCSGRVYAQVVESTLARRWNKLDAVSISNGTQIEMTQTLENCPGSMSVHDLQLSRLDQRSYKTILPPKVVFEFDWSGKEPIVESRRTRVEGGAVTAGVANAVLMWWDLSMNAACDMRLSCAPAWLQPAGDLSPWRDHWIQEIYHLPRCLAVAQNQPVALLTCHDEYSFWFGFHSAERIVDDLPQPMCTCNLHYVCSRQRLGELNDPHRKLKYNAVLKKKVKSNSVVLASGDCSLMGLVAAKLGAEMVYCYENQKLAIPVYEDLIAHNKLDGKVKIVSTQQELDEIIGKVNLCINEPFFRTSKLPWENIRFRTEGSCSNVIPCSASIQGVVVQFEHLHKIRVPVDEVMGFKMTDYNEMIHNAILKADNPIEVHPLWEYKTKALSKPFTLFELNMCDTAPQKPEFFETSFELEVPGRIDAVVLWVDYMLDELTKISEGATRLIWPGDSVSWDIHGRQAVCFSRHRRTVNAKKGGTIKVKSTYLSNYLNMFFSYTDPEGDPVVLCSF